MALIYIVEDDKNIREIETFAMGNVGYEVQDFACAGDFYKALEEKKPEEAAEAPAKKATRKRAPKKAAAEE